MVAVKPASNFCVFAFSDTNDLTLVIVATRRVSLFLRQITCILVKIRGRVYRMTIGVMTIMKNALQETVATDRVTQRLKSQFAPAYQAYSGVS